MQCWHKFIGNPTCPTFCADEEHIFELSWRYYSIFLDIKGRIQYISISRLFYLFYSKNYIKFYTLQISTYDDVHKMDRIVYIIWLLLALFHIHDAVDQDINMKISARGDC